jgi:ammonium transporter, Amt family
MSLRLLSLLPVILLALASPAAASEISAGDTAWILASSALVLLMIPGLALFYGGMVRSKNVLGTIMHSMFAMGIIGIQWVIIGYSMAFSEGNWFVGGFDYVFLRGVGLEAEGSIPHLTFIMFQGMFAIITPALITGAFAERIKFKAYAAFILIWAILVYNPICHWVWGPGGWLGEMGALDFAGGTVVHMSSGFSALVAAIMVGRRIGYPNEPMLPNSLIWTVLGAGMLWFGWFGFNGGSALAADSSAALAFATTQIAASAGAFSWAVVEWIRTGRPTVLGVASGIVAGLVAITPAAGFVGPMSALAIGLTAGAICYGAVIMKGKFGYDDSLDVFGIHGIGGLLGALLTGVFAREMWGGADGLIAGNGAQLLVQFWSVLATAAYAIVASYVILKIIDLTIGLRVDADEERQGLDTSQHGETAYNI